LSRSVVCFLSSGRFVSIRKQFSFGATSWVRGSTDRNFRSRSVTPLEWRSIELNQDESFVCGNPGANPLGRSGIVNGRWVPSNTAIPRTVPVSNDYFAASARPRSVPGWESVGKRKGADPLEKCAWYLALAQG
jgi:hypothetical protein